MKLDRYIVEVVVVSLSFALIAGCSASGVLFRDPAVLVRDLGRIVGRPKFEKNIVRIVTLWEASRGKDPNDKPSRGFAGQVLFFGPECNTGARVRGKVVIYEYDNYDIESNDDPIPLHSFTFEAEAWDLHRTEGTLGHSYSCFIPYMKKHKEQVKCGLKVEFIAEDGRKTSSDIVEVLLPSRTTGSPATAMTRGFVRESQIGNKPLITRESAEENSDKADSLDSFSIALPKQAR